MTWSVCLPGGWSDICMFIFLVFPFYAGLLYVLLSTGSHLLLFFYAEQKQSFRCWPQSHCHRPHCVSSAQMCILRPTVCPQLTTVCLQSQCLSSGPLCVLRATVCPQTHYVSSAPLCFLSPTVCLQPHCVSLASLCVLSCPLCVLSPTVGAKRNFYDHISMTTSVYWVFIKYFVFFSQNVVIFWSLWVLLVIDLPSSQGVYRKENPWNFFL